MLIFCFVTWECILILFSTKNYQKFWGAPFLSTQKSKINWRRATFLYIFFSLNNFKCMLFIWIFFWKQVGIVPIYDPHVFSYYLHLSIWEWNWRLYGWLGLISGQTQSEAYYTTQSVSSARVQLTSKRENCKTAQVRKKTFKNFKHFLGICSS